MDLNAIRALYDDQEREHLKLIGFTREDLGTVVRFIPPTPVRNSFIFYQRLAGIDAAALDLIIEDQVAYCRPRSNALGWKFCSHDNLPPLEERLAAHDFIRDEDSAVMVMELDNLPPSLRKPIQNDIRRKHPGDDVSDIVTVLNGAFGGNGNERAVKVTYEEMCTDPTRISMYVGYVDGQPASACWIRFPGEGHAFASLWAGSTLPQYRKRGLYTDLLNIRAQEALQRGYKFLCIEAGDMSAPIVERHGFRTLSTMIEYTYSFNPD